MEYTSKCPDIINRKQLRKCVELLEKEYQDLPYHIYMYKNAEQLMTERKNQPDIDDDAYEYILSNAEFVPPGVCIHEKKLIKIFPFNLDDEDIRVVKCKIIYNVYHEIRHAWQHLNNQFLEEPETKLEKECMHEYFSLSSEKDAYWFADEEYNKHVIEIQNILEINDLPPGVVIKIDSKGLFPR